MPALGEEPALVPVHATLECAAAFAADPEPAEEGGATLPLAVLDFDRFPKAAALFGTLLDLDDDTRFVGTAEPWVSLSGDDHDNYDREHEGHPLIRFLIGPQSDKMNPIAVLSFRVCVRCSSAFMRQVTTCDEMGVIGAVPDGVNPDDDDLLPEILPVAIDPGYIGYVELRAWRLRYA